MAFGPVHALSVLDAPALPLLPPAPVGLAGASTSHAPFTQVALNAAHGGGMGCAQFAQLLAAYAVSAAVTFASADALIAMPQSAVQSFSS